MSEKKYKIIIYKVTWEIELQFTHTEKFQLIQKWLIVKKRSKKRNNKQPTTTTNSVHVCGLILFENDTLHTRTQDRTRKSEKPSGKRGKQLKNWMTVINQRQTPVIFFTHVIWQMCTRGFFLLLQWWDNGKWTSIMHCQLHLKNKVWKIWDLFSECPVVWLTCILSGCRLLWSQQSVESRHLRHQISSDNANKSRVVTEISYIRPTHT